MSDFFFKTTNFIKSFVFFSKPQQKRGWAPFKKKKHHAPENQRDLKSPPVVTDGDPQTYHRGTTEKLGKPSGLKDTDEVG